MADISQIQLRGGATYDIKDAVARAHPFVLQNNVDYFADPDDLPASATVGTLAFVESSSNILNLVYPVGSIYMSVNDTSPATLFGGTWERIQDTFLLASGSTYTAGTTGGEAAHTLNVNEIPSHEGHLHSNTGLPTGTGTATSKYLQIMSSYGSAPRGWLDLGQEYYPAGESRGGGLAHNNMPPYLAVYVWKRTA